MNIRIIPGQERLAFLPKHFGALMILAESTIYHCMSSLTNGSYEGGYWEYAEVEFEEQTVPLLLPPLGPNDGKWTLIGNYKELDLSVQGTGVVVMLFALGLLFSRDSPLRDRLVGYYHALMDATKSHPEHSSIHALID